MASVGVFAMIVQLLRAIVISDVPPVFGADAVVIGTEGGYGRALPGGIDRDHSRNPQFELENPLQLLGRDLFNSL